MRDSINKQVFLGSSKNSGIFISKKTKRDSRIVKVLSLLSAGFIVFVIFEGLIV